MACRALSRQKTDRCYFVRNDKHTTQTDHFYNSRARRTQQRAPLFRVSRTQTHSVRKMVSTCAWHIVASAPHLHESKYVSRNKVHHNIQIDNMALLCDAPIARAPESTIAVRSKREGVKTLDTHDEQPRRIRTLCSIATRAPYFCCSRTNAMDRECPTRPPRGCMLFCERARVVFHPVRVPHHRRSVQMSSMRARELAKPRAVSSIMRASDPFSRV